MRALCFHYATTLLHSYTLKLTTQLLEQNSSHNQQPPAPKEGFQATTVSFPTSHPFQPTAHVGASGSRLQLHYTSIPAMPSFVPYVVVRQIDDSAAALARWSFLPPSRRAAFKDIVAASSLLKNRTVMMPMTIRQARAIRPRTLKPMITTFVSSSILEAVQVFLLLIRLVGGKSVDPEMLCVR
jgi:hypothetical protein